MTPIQIVSKSENIQLFKEPSFAQGRKIPLNMMVSGHQLRARRLYAYHRCQTFQFRWIWTRIQARIGSGPESDLDLDLHRGPSLDLHLNLDRDH